MNGLGFPATAVTMAVTYVFGLLLDASGALAEWAAHVTPGQASLVVGLLGLGLQLVKWLVERRDKRRARAVAESADS